MRLIIPTTQDHQMRWFFIKSVNKKEQVLYTFAAGVVNDESILALATVASQRVDTLRVLWADPTVEAFIDVWEAVEESEQTKHWPSKFRNTFSQVNGSCPPKTHAEPGSITCTGEIACLSGAPVISSGRRETMWAAAPVRPRQVFADWMGTTLLGALRTFIYIWTQKESELQICLILYKSFLHFPKMVVTTSSIP